MIVAIPFENGSINQHFGHSEQFKIYTVEKDKALMKSRVVSTEGQGHGALAAFLTGLDVNVVICGGIGDGAMASLEAAGIAVHSGVNGFCDAAARAFKNGKLESLQCSTCDSHGPEGCSHSCSSCGH